MIKAVLIDIDNTLLDFDAYVKQSMKEGFSELGICRYQDSMYDVFLKINTQLWHDIEKGKLTFGELMQVRWNKIFEALGVEYDGYSFEKYFRGRLFDNAIPVEGAHELLAYLGEKYILCAASNGPYEQQINRLKVGNMYDCFTHCFISEKVGASKPVADFFSYCMRVLNEGRGETDKILPSQVVMIGDSLTSDIAGARSFGMKACLFNRDGKASKTANNADYTVSSLCKIKEIF